MAEKRNVQIIIDNIDCTGYLVDGTLAIEDAIGERSTCSFNLIDKAGDLLAILKAGETVEVCADGVKVYGGSIDKPKSKRTPAGTLAWTIDCVDWHQIADRRIVAETYENQTADVIVRDIIDKYLAVEGITYTMESVQVGPLVVECVFNYATATSCLDTLSERAGYSWWIDAHKVLNFVARATYLAPWPLDGEAKISDLNVEDSRQGYRNRQYVKAGKDVTDPQSESFKGDGASRTWTVGFPIAKVPTIKVNGVPKTVGIKGIDEGKDFYWNKGDPTITQDTGAPVLTSSETLQVTYQGLFDVVVLTDDYTAIEERKAVEGGTGYYEAVDDEPYLSSRESAIQSANAKLRKHAQFSKVITFSTWEPGLRPGQIIVASRPGDRLYNEEFLIDQVSFAEVGSDFYQYHVHAVSGESLGGWATFFKNMATRGQAFVIRENIREDQVLIRLVQSQEGWHWAEETPVAVFACPVPSENLYPSETLYPC